MAVYPEGNPGRYPVDPLTNVGRFRLLYGDSSGVPYDPETPGYRNYAELSDAEIEAFIDQGAGSITQGIGWLYLAMAGKAAVESKSVKDQDLAIDTTKRAADLRALAQFWFDREEVSQGGDYFDVVTIGGDEEFIPEGAPAIYGRRYTMGRWF